MANPSVVNAQPTDGGSTFTKPTGLADNDVLYLLFNAFGNNLNGSNEPGAPSGFTEVYSTGGNIGHDPTPWVACYRKKITSASGEPADYTVGTPAGGYGSSAYQGGILYAVRGADLTTPEDDSGSAGTTSGTNVNPATTGSIIDSSGADWLLLLNCTNTVTNSPSTPTDMANDFSGDGGDVRCYSQSSAGSGMSSAVRTSTLAANAQWAIGFIVVKPAAGGTVDITGTPAKVVVKAAVGAVGGQTDITGTPAVVNVKAAVGQVTGGASVDITGTPATVRALANVGVVNVTIQIAKIADRGARTSTSAGDATVTITNPTLIAVGNYLVARVSVDNSGSSGARPGLAVSDSRSHTWTAPAGALQDPGAASAGVAVYLCYVKVVTPFQAGDTVLFDYTTGSPLSAIVLEEWTGIHKTTPLAVAQNTGNNVSSTAQPSIARTPSAAGQLMYVAAGIEGISTSWGSQDSDTTNGSWSEVTKDEANTGTASTSQSVYGGYKIVTASGAQTWNNTLGVTSDWAACAVVFAVEPNPANLSGTAAKVVVKAGIGQVATPIDISGTPATVTVKAAVGVAVGEATVTGTPAKVVAKAAIGVAVGQATVTGTPAVVTVKAAVGQVGSSAPAVDITGTPATVTVKAAIGQVGGNATVAGTPAVVTVEAAVGPVAATQPITGTPAVVGVKAAIGPAFGGLAGLTAKVVVKAGVAPVVATQPITGTPAVVTVKAGVGSLSATIAITGTPAKVTVKAGPDVVTAHAAVAGVAAKVAITAGIAPVVGRANLLGLAAVVVVLAGVMPPTHRLGTGTLTMTGPSGTLTMTGPSGTLTMTGPSGEVTITP